MLVFVIVSQINKRGKEKNRPFLKKQAVVLF